MRKTIHGYFKQYAHLSEVECCYTFFDILSKLHRFELESFRCSLGVSEASVSSSVIQCFNIRQNVVGICYGIIDCDLNETVAEAKNPSSSLIKEVLCIVDFLAL